MTSENAVLAIENTPRPAPPAAPCGFALWRLGFRPFYLAASLLAALSVPLWAVEYAGLLPTPYVRAPVWHAHEMLFGFALAVVTGFLFTAVRNWTQRPTPTGGPLAALVLLWLAARVLVLTPYAAAAAAVNIAFPIAVAIGIGVPLVRSGNRRNYFFVAILLAIAAAALAFHLAQMDVIAWPARASLQVALDVLLFVIAVMGGRVIPMYTNNGVPGAGAARTPQVERFALGSVLALIAADLVDAPAALVVTLAVAAALAHGARLALWRPWRTRRVPMVWVLHAAYAWIVVYLLLRALAAAGLVPAPLATHALTIGAIGGMTIGMMTRTARGHTGRRLVADRAEVAAYTLVQAGAIVRVGGGLLGASLYLPSVVIAALAWSAAFAIYAVRYWPVLSRPRADGRPD